MNWPLILREALATLGLVIFLGLVLILGNAAATPMPGEAFDHWAAAQEQGHD